MQRRILGLYRSDTLVRTLVGFWAKLLVEFAVVALPVGVFVTLPGLIAAEVGVHPAITVTRVVGLSVTFVVTVTGFVWCFTAATAE